MGDSWRCVRMENSKCPPSCLPAPKPTNWSHVDCPVWYVAFSQDASQTQQRLGSVGLDTSGTKKVFAPLLSKICEILCFHYWITVFLTAHFVAKSMLSCRWICWVTYVCVVDAVHCFLPVVQASPVFSCIQMAACRLYSLFMQCFGTLQSECCNFRSHVCKAGCATNDNDCFCTQLADVTSRSPWNAS